MNDRKDIVLRGGPAGRDRQRAGEGSITYHHAAYEDGQHWFSAEHDGDEVGHAHVIEQQGPGNPHAEIRQLWTNPHYRCRGIGSRLLDNVAGHFKGGELRLKPYPTGKDGDPDEGELREYYSNRGFGDYQLKDGDPFELYDYMTKRGSRGPLEKAGREAAVQARERIPICGAEAAARHWQAVATVPAAPEFADPPVRRQGQTASPAVPAPDMRCAASVAAESFPATGQAGRPRQGSDGISRPAPRLAGEPERTSRPRADPTKEHRHARTR